MWGNNSSTFSRWICGAKAAIHISCINTGKAALHMGKQQQYIVGKAASHVGKTVAVCMWKSSCACGKTAAVYMWEKQLYMWENRTCTESTYILYVHKEWCAGISSLIHLWESSSCQCGKIQLCMWGNSSSVLGKSSCKWYKKNSSFTENKATLLYTWDSSSCQYRAGAAAHVGKEQLYLSMFLVNRFLRTPPLPLFFWQKAI